MENVCLPVATKKFKKVNISHNICGYHIARSWKGSTFRSHRSQFLAIIRRFSKLLFSVVAPGLCLSAPFIGLIISTSDKIYIMESSEGSMEIQGDDRAEERAVSAPAEETVSEPQPDAVDEANSEVGEGESKVAGVVEDKISQDIKMETELSNDGAAAQHGGESTSQDVVDADSDAMEIKEEGKEGETPASEDDIALSAAALASLVSLRGKLTSGENGMQIFKGVWAMNDVDHTSGLTGEFEYKLVHADPDSRTFPVNGLYKGHYMMKAGKSWTKYIDDLTLRFAPKGNESVDAGGEFNISGRSQNKHGDSKLQGTLDADLSLVVYKIALPTISTQNLKRRKSDSGGISRQSSTSSLPPRESTPRMRTEKVKVAPELLQPLPPRAASVQRQSSISSVASESGNARRPTGQLAKCNDLLKEMMRYPSATWFLEPVDHVKMNIPDYPLIIKEPMDFRTIKEKLEEGAYETADKFASDMRLVFKNAITYNHMKESPVHMAAKELSTKFEEKIRILKGSSSSAASDTSESRKKAVAAKPVPPKVVPVKAAAAVSHSTATKPVGGSSKSSGSGPRAAPEPPASTMQILEMQKTIAMMQNEINKLRSEVGTVGTGSAGATKKNASAKPSLAASAAVAAAPVVPSLTFQPLTFDEKKTLISQIHALQPQKLAKVVEIIQASLPPGRTDDNGEEVEIPIDELDTATLRKLQDYVENSSKKRPKIPGATPLSRSASMSSVDTNGGAVKRQKKESSNSSKPSDIVASSAIGTNTGMTKSLSADANLNHALLETGRPSKTS